MERSGATERGLRGPGPDTTTLLPRLLAESIGTAALVVVAAGADAAAEVTGGAVGPAARAVAPALLVAAMIYALGDVSGAHFNPAVSLAFFARGLFPVRWLAPYWFAQLLGAVAGAVIVAAMFGSVTPGVSVPHVAAERALGLEAILTFLLVTVILGTAERARVLGPNAALAVGATIALAGLVALPVEGASMNPARSFGPALVSGHLGGLWIYVVGPVAGALLAVAIDRVIHGRAERNVEAVGAAKGQSTTH